VGVFCETNSDGKIFGFAEFVQAFALLILIYTFSDVRYRFRVATAPIPIWWITFWMSVVIRLGTLIVDLRFTRYYLLPWFLAAQSYWQFVFGIMDTAVQTRLGKIGYMISMRRIQNLAVHSQKRGKTRSAACRRCRDKLRCVGYDR
jgi:hypothetical protein